MLEPVRQGTLPEAERVDVTLRMEGFRTRGSFYEQGGKRALDLALVILTLPVCLPLMAGCAALMALEGGRPFYTHVRVGRNGKPFRLWKLRTMVADADDRLEALLASDPAAREEWARAQKLRDDPRITAVGRLLRAAFLDELPQLLNVLRGEMSLVGPRPMMPGQQPLYPGSSYYRLRPGMTGFWQISNRDACRFRDRARFDDMYAGCLSLGTDLAVLWRTVGTVLSATGR